MIGIIILISIVFGYELASNQGKITYDLYKFSAGGIDWTQKSIPGPADRVKENQIEVTKDNIIIQVPDAEWSSYSPTGSMEPVLSDTANGLYLKPKGPEDIKIGDIIAYDMEGQPRPIVHRVTSIQKDQYGNVQYITKGDSNAVPDPEPVPYDKVLRVLIGILY